MNRGKGEPTTLQKTDPYRTLAEGRLEKVEREGILGERRNLGTTPIRRKIKKENLLDSQILIKTTQLGSEVDWGGGQHW